MCLDGLDRRGCLDSFGRYPPQQTVETTSGDPLGPHTKKTKKTASKISMWQVAASTKQGSCKCCIKQALMWSNPHRAPTHNNSRSARCKELPRLLNNYHSQLHSSSELPTLTENCCCNFSSGSGGGGNSSTLHQDCSQDVSFDVRCLAGLAQSALLFRISFFHTPSVALPLPNFWPSAAPPSLEGLSTVTALYKPLHLDPANASTTWSGCLFSSRICAHTCKTSCCLRATHLLLTPMHK